MRTIHTLSLMSKYWIQIQKGLKTVEGRIYDGKVKYIKLRDIIAFSQNGQPDKKLFCKVTQINRFDTFHVMLLNMGLSKCLPDAQSTDEGVAIYHGFPNYAEKEKKYGVIAFTLEHISKFKPSSKKLK